MKQCKDLLKTVQQDQFLKKVLGPGVRLCEFVITGIMQSGEIGIDPNYIQALSWLERRAFETMRNLTYEDQSQAYRQDWLFLS